MDRHRRRRQRVSVAVSMATEHMRDGVTRAIRRGTHHGGGFSCWHTRAVGRAVSAAFTFLPKIEGYGGGSRPFFLCLSSSSPSSFSTFLLLPLFFFFLFRSLRPYLHLVPFLFLSLSFLITFSRRACRAYVSKSFFFLRCTRRRAYTCQRDVRGCSRICRNSARVRTTKNK